MKLIFLSKNYTKMEVYLYTLILVHLLLINKGWSGGAMVLGKLPVSGRPTIWITVGQGLVGWLVWGLTAL